MRYPSPPSQAQTAPTTLKHTVKNETLPFTTSPSLSHSPIAPHKIAPCGPSHAGSLGSLPMPWETAGSGRIHLGKPEPAREMDQPHSLSPCTSFNTLWQPTTASQGPSPTCTSGSHHITLETPRSGGTRLGKPEPTRDTGHPHPPSSRTPPCRLWRAMVGGM